MEWKTERENFNGIWVVWDKGYLKSCWRTEECTTWFCLELYLLGISKLWTWGKFYGFIYLVIIIPYFLKEYAGGKNVKYVPVITGGSGTHGIVEIDLIKVDYDPDTAPINDDMCVNLIRAEYEIWIMLIRIKRPLYVRFPWHDVRWLLVQYLHNTMETPCMSADMVSSVTLWRKHYKTWA